MILQKRKKKLAGILLRDDPDGYMRTRLEEDFNSIQLTSSETQGQIVGKRECLNRRKNMT